jgi:hypothetical protein
MTTQTKPDALFPEARAKKLNKRKTIWLIALFGVMAIGLGGGILGGIAGYSDVKSGTSFGEGLVPIVMLVGGLVAGLLSLWWSLHYWKSIDEMARRAHLDSWFWGGTLGGLPLGVLGVVTMAVPEFKLDMLERMALSSTQVFGLGAVAIYGCMVLGYTIFWLIWWARKR